MLVMYPRGERGGGGRESLVNNPICTENKVLGVTINQ